MAVFDPGRSAYTLHAPSSMARGSRVAFSGGKWPAGSPDVDGGPATAIEVFHRVLLGGVQ